MVGGAGGFTLKNQFNRAWQARRQPGSSFKAFVYTAAIDNGMPPTTIVEDSPVSYPMGDGTQWAPMDDDNRYLRGDDVALRARAIAQRRRREARREDRHRSRDRVREAHGDQGAARAEPLARARQFGRLAARYGLRLCDDRERRDPHRSLADPRRARFARHDRARQSLPAADRSDRRRDGLRDDDDAAERHRRRDGLSERRDRPPRRRQDGDDLRFPRRVVRRFHAGSRRRRVDRQRRLPAHERVVRREHPGAHLGPFHARGAREDAEERFRAARERSATRRDLRQGGSLRIFPRRDGSERLVPLRRRRDELHEADGRCRRLGARIRG